MHVFVSCDITHLLHCPVEPQQISEVLIRPLSGACRPSALKTGRERNLPRAFERLQDCLTTVT
jgi:hypothetical protein